MNIHTNLFLGYGKICKNFFSKSFIIFLQCVKQDHVWPDFYNPLFTVHFSSSNQRRLILLCVMENSWAGLGVGIVLSGLCVYNHITGKCVIIRICIPSTFLTLCQSNLICYLNIVKPYSLSYRWRTTPVEDSFLNWGFSCVMCMTLFQ